nr:translocation/assembly module TamB [Sphingopyxis sp.]
MTVVRRSLAARIALWAGGVVAVLVILAGAAALLIDTQPGHRFVADRIAAMEMQNGLKIRVGRIDGSLYSRTRLRDVQLLDLDGRFARISEAELEWHPFQFLLANRLDIDSLFVSRAQWDRYPRLRPADPDAPILPDFDIAIDSVRVDRLVIGADIVGSQRVARANGRAIIESGRADVALDARLIDGDDRIALALIAEPDRDRFDINA